MLRLKSNHISKIGQRWAFREWIIHAVPTGYNLLPWFRMVAFWNVLYFPSTTKQREESRISLMCQQRESMSFENRAARSRMLSLHLKLHRRRRQTQLTPLWRVTRLPLTLSPSYERNDAVQNIRFSVSELCTSTGQRSNKGQWWW